MFGKLIRSALIVCTVSILGVGFGASAHTPHDDVFSVAVSPDFETDRTVYTLTRSSVLKSTDAGQSWTRMIRGLDNTQMLVDLALGPNGQTLYAASRGEGVFRSLDGGETWTNASSGLSHLHIHRLSVSPINAADIIAVSAEGDVFLSRTSGESWSELEGPFCPISAAAFGSSSNSDVNILVGDVCGNVLTRMNGGDWSLLLSADNATPISVITTNGPNTIAIGDNAGRVFLHTGEAGDIREQTISDTTAPITSITFSPDYANDSRIFATHWKDGLFCSTTPEASWAACDAGLTIDQQAAQLGRPNFSDVAISPTFTNDQTLYVAAYDGLFQSSDGAIQHTELETFPINYIVSASFSPNFVEDQQMLLTTMLWGLFETTDGGASWQDINSGELIDYPRHNGLTRLFRPIYSPDFENDQTVFLSTWYAPLRSTNGGKDWQRLEAPQTDSFREKRHQALVLATSPDFTNDQTVFASTNWGEIIRSTDGGTTFETVAEVEGNSGSLEISPNFVTDGLIFSGDITGIWRSDDSGATWTQTPLVPADKLAPHIVPVGYPTEEIAGFIEFLDVERGKSQTQRLILSPDFTADGLMFVAGSEGLFRSADKGLTWAPITGEGLTGRAYIEAVATSPNFASDQTLLVSVRGKGLFKSIDAGISFAPFAP
ncbi:MAG: hypothetical protein AAFS13_07575, partial [Pseudomonadota bacterium]